MKTIRTKLVSIALVIVMILGVMPLSVFAADGDMVIAIDQKTALAGSTVTININFTNNPGISSTKLKVAYDDSVLTLASVSYNPDLGGQSIQPQNLSTPVTLTWVSPFANYSADGTFATLTFTVAEDAEADAVASISATYDPNDIYNMDEVNVDCSVETGYVKIVQGVPGDINGDLACNNKDITRMFQYLAGWEVYVNTPMLDTNGDGSINNKDLTRLFHYLADWEVEIFPPVPPPVEECSHNLEATPANAPLCEQVGNIAYWYCSLCEKYFSDAAATTEIAFEDTFIPATGHNVIVDPAVEPTYDSTGLTEGSHCDVCGEILVAQQVIDKITQDSYSIRYFLSNGDEYLATQSIENPNPTSYTSQEGVTRFSNPEVPGYNFLGWYDLPSGDAAENIKTIPVGTTGNYDLYARWEKIPYKINFSSELIPVESETYTVDEQHLLPSPKLDGYVFVGWSDDDGNVIKSIPVGNIGAKTYTANWLSERNQAWTNNVISEPLIYEDDETNTILFAYNIGEIRNVPVSVIHDFGKINSSGVTKTVTTEVSKTVSESCMNTYTNTVQKATTDSFAWTLSSEWSDSVSVNEEWAKETGLTEEEIHSKYRDDSRNWFVSSGSSGSTTTSTVTGTDTTTLESTTKNDSHTSSDSSTTKDEISATLNASMSVKGVGKIEAGMSGTMSAENEHLDSTIKGETNSDGTNVTEYGKVTTDTFSSWNSESGYGGSSTVGQSDTVSKAISKKLSEKYNIGKSYINTDSSSNTQGKTSSSSSTEEYSSSVTYSIQSSETRTETFTTENTVSGYHRWVMAGTAHVFAIVGYDIATASYFVTTYSIMDDEIYEYEDYSYLSASYNDNETGVISFEVPYTEIVEYVGNRIGKTEGLVISKSGEVTDYTGTDKEVLIPEYTVVDNKDGTISVVKVTSISSNAFAGKDINTVIFSDNITEIQDAAFKNCKTLKHISAVSVTKIGNEAFYGCTSLDKVIIGDNVTELGTNVVGENTKLGVVAANASVINVASQSAAKEVTIAVSDKFTDFNSVNITIPNTCDYFAFYGYGNNFGDFKIESNAAKTIISRVNIMSNTQTPLVISSADIELQEINIESPGICLALKADTTNIALRGESTLTSTSDNSMLCKKITLSQCDSSLTSSLTVNGNLLICDSEACILEGENLLIVKGEILGVTSEEYNNFLRGLLAIRFDANGGSVLQSSKEVIYSSAIGELPTPTWTYHTFEGWYTEANGGTKIIEETIMTYTEDITLYAHWTENSLSDWILVEDLPDDVKNAPEGMYEFEYANGYSTSTLERKTSGYASEAGWTMELKTQIGSASYGGWQTSAPATSSTQSETYHTVVSDDTLKVNACHAWVSSDNKSYWKDNSSGTYSKHIYIYSSVPLASSGYSYDTANDGSYVVSHQTIGINSPGKFGTIYLMRDVKNNTNLTSHSSYWTDGSTWWPAGESTLHRTKTEKFQYTHTRWTDWSEMTMEEIEPTDSLKVDVTENAYVRYRAL